MLEPSAAAQEPSQERTRDGAPAIPERTGCCIVGGGPAGAVLALLLARGGVPVTLLEAHRDFDREFRGDTIHPSTLELLDDLGLAGRLLELPHTKVGALTIGAGRSALRVDLSRLPTRFPFVMLMPQTRFLEFVTEEAGRCPDFRLVLGANVKELVEEGGSVRGVRFPSEGGMAEVRAPLTVGADGRFSRLRRLAGFRALATSPPMDVLWFRLPRRPEDPAGALARIVSGGVLVALDRGGHWQMGYVIRKGSYGRLREQGIEALRRRLAVLAPELSDRVAHLREWRDVSLLQVASDRLARWYRPGLLLIGDAAHVMSPVGGVGINVAIGDAVVAANVLAGPLRKGALDLERLRKVQRRRERAVRAIQAMQSLLQRRVIAGVLDASDPVEIPAVVRWLFRVPFLRDLPPRLLFLAPGRPRLEG